MFIKTERLTIRKFKYEDIDSMVKILSDMEVMKYIEDVFTFDQTKIFYEKYGLSEDPRVFAIVYEQNNEVIGHLIFGEFNSKSYEVGFIFNKNYWNRGLASEILISVIEYSRKILLYSLIIECDIRQDVTKHIAIKNGFSFICYNDNLIVFELIL